MRKYFGRKSQWLCIILYILGLVLCTIVNSTPVSHTIVEAVGGTSKDRWYLYIPRLCLTVALDFTLIFAIAYSRLTFNSVHEYWHNNYESFKALFRNKEIFNKRNAIIFIVLLIVSFIGFFALLRANVTYVDDIRRNIETYYDWGNNYGRWGTALINLIIQGGYTLGDRSPLNQIIAIICLVVSALILSLVMTRLFKKDKIGSLSIIASSTVIFTPYFLQCLSYKYDSVGMGLSVLAAIFPFLALGNRKFFLWLSCISLVTMCTFYQSSNGIYIIMVIFIGFIDYCLNIDRTISDIIKFYVESALAFLVAMILFYFFILPTGFDPITEHTAISIGSNVIKNIGLYFRCLFYDFNTTWKIIVLLLVIASSVVMMIKTKRSKFFTLCLLVLMLVIASILSYGAFILISDEGFGDRGRYLYCFGFLLAVLANISVMSEKLSLGIPACILAWIFFSYASAYGNALSYDRDYTDFMEKQVISDINEFFIGEEYPELKIVFTGDTNNLRPVEYLSSKYPITERMITGFLHYDGVEISSYWATRHFVYYDNSLSPERKNYDPDITEGKLIVQKRYYDIYFYEPDLVHVLFKKL